MVGSIDMSLSRLFFYASRARVLTVAIIIGFGNCVQAEVVAPADFKAPTEFIVTLRAPDTSDDKRKNYTADLIALALEKTKSRYGNYTIKSVLGMNTPRLLAAISANVFPNLVVEISYDETIAKNSKYPNH